MDRVGFHSMTWTTESSLFGDGARGQNLEHLQSWLFCGIVFYKSRFWLLLIIEGPNLEIDTQFDKARCSRATLSSDSSYFIHIRARSFVVASIWPLHVNV